MSGTQDLSILAMVASASVVVQLVMLLLLVVSFMSWYFIFLKVFTIGRAKRKTEHFERDFWSGSDLAALYQSAVNHRHSTGSLERIFEAGFREFARLRQRRQMDARTMLEGAQRGMRVAETREIDRLEQNLEFLANVGSISPYVGLFGTVWGIMIAFQGLANVKEATIAMVAPGISEALIATAMGLFAAIPAVWAYNRYSNKLERIQTRYENFVEEFSSILQRQAHVDDVG